MSTYQEDLKCWIRNSEQRFISYKKMLEEVHRDRDAFPPDEPFVIQHKQSLRDAKNEEEAHLHSLIEQRVYEGGVTPSSTKRWLEQHQRTSKLKDLVRSLENALELDELKEHHNDMREMLAKIRR